MNEYRKRALLARQKVSKLTLAEQRQLARLYENSIDNLIKKASKAKDKSLTKRWALDYAKELERAKNLLYEEIRKQTIRAVEMSAELAVQPEEWFYKEVFKKISIDIGPHFTQMLSQVQKNVINDIISGELYKDHRTLSSRIWDISNSFEKDIQYIINQAMIEKKSAINLADDLEKFVKEPAKRPTTWGKTYPNLRSRVVDYNAMRLARTTINHSYQTATIQSSSINPFVEKIEWRSALIHGRTCKVCQERHGQKYDKDDVPLDHPNGLCTMLPYIPQTLDEVAGELRNWLDGANNPKLDKWYKEHGEYFAFKTL